MKKGRKQRPYLCFGPKREEELQIFSCARLPDGRFLFRPAKGSFRRYTSESSLDIVVLRSFPRISPKISLSRAHNPDNSGYTYSIKMEFKKGTH